jgi:hypothetical protein
MLHQTSEHLSDEDNFRLLLLRNLRKDLSAKLDGYLFNPSELIPSYQQEL